MHLRTKGSIVAMVVEGMVVEGMAEGVAEGEAEKRSKEVGVIIMYSCP
jgi:hypothetical protein